MNFYKLTGVVAILLPSTVVLAWLFFIDERAALFGILCGGISLLWLGAVLWLFTKGDKK